MCVKAKVACNSEKQYWWLLLSPWCLNLRTVLCGPLCKVLFRLREVGASRGFQEPAFPIGVPVKILSAPAHVLSTSCRAKGVGLPPAARGKRHLLAKVLSPVQRRALRTAVYSPTLFFSLTR